MHEIGLVIWDGPSGTWNGPIWLGMVLLGWSGMELGQDMKKALGSAALAWTAQSVFG